MYDVQDYDPALKYGGDLDLSTLDISNLSTLDVTGATTLGSTLAVTGAATLSSTLGVTGATTLSSTLAVTGAATLSSTLAYSRLTEDTTATNVITAAESGTVFFLNSATEFVSTLPAPAAGLHFRFIVKAAPSGASYTVVTDSSANIIEGTVVVNGASVNGANEDTITFADGAAVAGDWAEVISDGTSWYVSGVGSAAGAITLTQAS